MHEESNSRSNQTPDRAVKANLPADEQMWHRKHRVAAVWAIATGIVVALGMKIYDNARGPQLVYIANADTTTRIVASSDSLTAEYLETLVQEIRVLQRTTAAAGYTQVRDGVNVRSPNGIQLPSFELPEPVDGYTSRALGVLAATSCPDSVVPAGSDIWMTVVLRDPSLVPSLTPIFADLSVQQSENRFLRFFDQQYSIGPENTLVFPAPRDEREFRLQVGVYLREDLDQQYPPFYRIECSMRTVM